jgi:hypothetical protein
MVGSVAEINEVEKYVLPVLGYKLGRGLGCRGRLRLPKERKYVEVSFAASGYR